MELKNALAVCLISLFSATLIVLIARSLDNQAAARLEPQLIRIADELQAIRSQGGIAAAEATTGGESMSNGLVVYYLHSNVRCPTCQAIESQARETVQNHFAAQLSDGQLMWKVVNYEQPSGKPLAAEYDVQMPVIVLVKMKDGKPADWKRLDKVWALVDDQPGFAEYVRGEIDKMLLPDKKPESPALKTIPVPDADDAPANTSPAIPVP